jgi:hypothetical protein
MANKSSSLGIATISLVHLFATFGLPERQAGCLDDGLQKMRSLFGHLQPFLDEADYARVIDPVLHETDQLVDWIEVRPIVRVRL